LALRCDNFDHSFKRPNEPHPKELLFLCINSKRGNIMVDNDDTTSQGLPADGDLLAPENETVDDILHNEPIMPEDGNKIPPGAPPTTPYDKQLPPDHPELDAATNIDRDEVNSEGLGRAVDLDKFHIDDETQDRNRVGEGDGVQISD
jgi:hypothetical protein